MRRMGREVRHETRIILGLVKNVEKCLLHPLIVSEHGQMAPGIAVVCSKQALVLWRHGKRLLLQLVARTSDIRCILAAIARLQIQLLKT